MHVKLVHKDSKQMIFVLFIYATNLPTDRRTLWSDLGAHKQVVRNLPWVLMGDFNVALNLEDYHSGPSVMSPPMIEFKDCVSKIEVMDINSSSIHYTWNQKPKGADLNIKEEEAVYLHAFNEAKLDEERLLQQKAKIDWLDPDCDNINSNEIFLKKVSNVANLNMVHPISEEEIKRAMFDIGNDKASRPDRKRISHKRTKNKAKNDKTEHGMERCEKTKPNQSQIVNQAKKSTEKSNSQSQSQPRQSQSQLREAEAENTT
ncbi:MACPF domain-containing protein CAD1 [Tanacetum coccineum]|uniref:MACPF domain-containing protein CAD1 n=1 Tax=Tanacetum coccineum TaxID=301880 RepID=A0ABQ5G961_9ASTR